MTETVEKMTKALEVVAPILPGPVVTVVTVLQVASAACSLIGGIRDELEGWWPW